MTDYQNFCNFLTAAQRGRTNTTPKISPTRTKAKPTPPRSSDTNANSDAILRREIINIFNGQ